MSVDAPPSSVPLTRRAMRELRATPLVPAAQIVTSQAPSAPPTASVIDPFEDAVRKLCTDQIPVSVYPGEQVYTTTATARHRVARKNSVARRMLTMISSAAAMGAAGLLTVAMTMPSNAVAVALGAPPIAAELTNEEPLPVADAETDIQVFMVPEGEGGENLDRTPVDYATVSLARLAAQQGIKFNSSLYINNPDAEIQWPIAFGSEMIYGYGWRWGRMHNGIDLVPGNGAPVQAIADGVVRVSSPYGGGYGVHVKIDHVIDGKRVTSHYAHLQYGSLKFKEGDSISVGDVVGLVGNTGASLGPHLHFEILIDGTWVDPVPFMQKYAG